MTNYAAGTDALDALNATNESGGGAEFTSFKSGSSFFVKVLGTADLITFYSYGIYKVINSFVADKPSKKSAKGYPVADLTVWDRAWKYHSDLSQEFNDHHGQEAGKYRAKQRFAMGFIDLDTGEPIIIDVSKNQAQAIHGAIKKYEKRIDKLAFELSKTGESTGTVVSLTPVIDMEEDLTDKQRENFAKAPATFDMALFNGLLFEIDEAEQVKLLTQAGFDVSLIGYGAEATQAGGNTALDGATGEVGDDVLPF